MICVSVQNKEQIKDLKEKGADMVELRFDLIKESPADIFPVIDKNLKIISTCRPGHYSDLERMEILSESIALGTDYIDIEIETGKSEIATLKDQVFQRDCAMIISWHDFRNTPGMELLSRVLAQCYENGADVAKIATMANSKADMVRLMSLYELPGRKVVIGMGKMAGITRVAAPLLGAEFTFASLTRGDETAPGQLTLDELNTVYQILNRS